MPETQGFSEKQTHREDLLWLAPGSHVGIVNELQNHPGFIMFSNLRNTQAVRARSQALGPLAFQSPTTLEFSEHTEGHYANVFNSSPLKHAGQGYHYRAAVQRMCLQLETAPFTITLPLLNSEQ